MEVDFWPEMNFFSDFIEQDKQSTINAPADHNYYRKQSDDKIDASDMDLSFLDAQIIDEINKIPLEDFNLTVDWFINVQEEDFLAMETAEEGEEIDCEMVPYDDNAIYIEQYTYAMLYGGTMQRTRE